MSNFSELLTRNRTPQTKEPDQTLQEYLYGSDPLRFATAPTRLLAAIGEPEIVDTSKEPRMGRLFQNKTIKRYPAFKDFFGIEEAIEDIVAFLLKASQGAEESRQLLYLSGPVAAGKSSLAERLKTLMEVHPIYVLATKDSLSPVFESPLGLFQTQEAKDMLVQDCKVPRSAMRQILSPWALKRFDEFDGDITQFRVRKIMPSQLRRQGVVKVQAGDAKQPIADLVGQASAHELNTYRGTDTDGYDYSGGLNRANQGLLEFVEIFKAQPALLHPLLTVTTEGNYTGTPDVGLLPFGGILLAHSNQPEWIAFADDDKNAALVSRTTTIEVPYCLRATEEAQIYDKIIQNSELRGAHCAPKTYEFLSRFTVQSRVQRPAQPHSVYDKIRVYDGELPSDVSAQALSLFDYRKTSEQEGMHGMSPRDAAKILATAYNTHAGEVAADPLTLLEELQKACERGNLPPTDIRVVSDLKAQYHVFLGLQIQEAYVEDYTNYGQNRLDQLFEYIDAYDRDAEYKDPDTQEVLSREALNRKIVEMEKEAGIADSSAFRKKILDFSLRYRAKHEGKNPHWVDEPEYRHVVEMLTRVSDEKLMLRIHFAQHREKKEQEEHEAFASRMVALGYTEIQVRRLVTWWIQVKMRDAR